MDFDGAGDRPDIGVGEALLLQERAAGLVDLGDGIGDGEAEDARRFVQPLGVLGELEDLAAIGALALEHGARIMQAVGEDVDLRVRPLHEFAVHPDVAVKLIEGNGCHADLPRTAVRTSLELFRLSRTTWAAGRILADRRTKAKRRKRRGDAPDLPFRSQSDEKLDENYQRTRDMSTRLTYFWQTETQ